MHVLFATLRLCVKPLDLTENQLSRIIVDVAYHLHCNLGPGLLESVYEEVMCHELRKRGLTIERQKAIPVRWDGIHMDMGFRADLIVEGKVILELKSVEMLAAVHSKQLLTYLKITGIKLGLLINFNESLIKNGIFRIVNGL